VWLLGYSTLTDIYQCFFCSGKKNDPTHTPVSSSIAEVRGNDGSAGAWQIFIKKRKLLLICLSVSILLWHKIRKKLLKVKHSIKTILAFISFWNHVIMWIECLLVICWVAGEKWKIVLQASAWSCWGVTTSCLYSNSWRSMPEIWEYLHASSGTLYKFEGEVSLSSVALSSSSIFCPYLLVKCTVSKRNYSIFYWMRFKEGGFLKY